MARPSNYKRDTEIYKKKEGIDTDDSWSFQDLADYFNMAKSSVYEAYLREKMRRKKGVRLSTGK